MPGFWRKCRITFRWFRIAVWLVVLAALAALLWLNGVGLPGFLKTRLVATLHERGVELEFSRMRLSLVRGVVADSVRIGQGKTDSRPDFSARQVQLRLNFPALLERRLQVDGLGLRDGKFTLPLSPTNQLALTNLQAELRFATNDTWTLDRFSGDLNGVRILLSGEVAHAPEIRNWKIFSRPAAAGSQGTTTAPLKDFSDTLTSVKFGGPPQLSVTFTGDARDVDSFRLRGELALTNTVARGMAVDRLRTHFLYFKHVWQLPDLELTQGRTRLRLAGEADTTTKDFRCRLNGALDAASVRPFLTTSNAAGGFNLLTFHKPLTLDLDADGNLRDFTRLAVTGHVALSDCAIRGQTVDRLTTGVTYSNLTAEFFHPQLSRAGGAQIFSAEKVLLDIAGEKLFIAHGAGHVEPMVVGRAIGPKTAMAMEPYQFPAVPETRVSGWIPLRQKDDNVVTDEADLRVDLVGTHPFRWRKFATPAITGTIRWWKNYLFITNAVTECYGGEARGWGKFDLLTPGAGTDFNFFINGTNVDLHRMGLALWSPTNSLEGALSGEITVSSANSDDWQTWNGFGALKLRNGLLWNVPIFGLISPMLNTVAPGLGNNRATEAAGNFTMTNGVIFTDSLKIHTALAQMDYVGTVDLDENVNARVTAQLMRNTPLLGSVVSTVLWPVSKIFECKVTGTLDRPRPVPVYFPKLLLAPLHPIQSLEQLLPTTEKPKG